MIKNRQVLSFPPVTFDNIAKKTMSIFKDKYDVNSPLVIYFPRISDHDLWEKHKSNPKYTNYNLSNIDLETITNEGFGRTINFHYTPEESRKLMDAMEFNVRVNMPKLIKALQWKIDQMSK